MTVSKFIQFSEADSFALEVHKMCTPINLPLLSDTSQEAIAGWLLWKLDFHFMQASVECLEFILKRMPLRNI